MANRDPIAARTRIAELIGDSVYHALGLKETLNEEFKALEQQDMDALNQALENKSSCVRELTTLENERKELCVASGFAAGHTQMADLIDWCDDGSVIADSWQHLLDIVIDCNTLNTRNGAIIQSRKQQIETSLAVICNGGATKDTYDRSGRSAATGGRHAIAEA